jgi:putative DNA primase/helicase
LVPFNVTIPDGKKDERLREKLLAESSGILNWALAGLASYRKDGLMEPKDVLAATEEYRSEEDWFSSFLESETAKSPTATVQAKDLYNRYKSWAEAGKERVLSERKFNDQMKTRGMDFCKKDNRKFYTGIQLSSLYPHTPTMSLD